MNASPSLTCPVCCSADLRPFFSLAGVPVYANVLLPTREEAFSVPRGDLELAFCSSCGHVFNTAFNPARLHYTPDYENSLHFSPRFQTYAAELASDLVRRYGLYGKDLVEIGCGRGDFLAMLCELGDNRGWGFDPGYNGEQDANPRLTVIRDYFSEKHAGGPADFILSRQVLEHIHRPRDFVHMVRRASARREGPVVFFEVPNVVFTLHELSIWDLIYEHYSFFSPTSLERLFLESGFEVLDVRPQFGGQYLSIEARPGPKQRASRPAGEAERVAELSADVDEFVRRYEEKTGHWEALLRDLRASGRRAVVWSAGSKGVMFLNMVETRDAIQYVVDINPRKHGMHIAGAGQRIVPPDFLREYRPEVVVVMNPIYQEEIRSMTRQLGLEVSFLQA